MPRSSEDTNGSPRTIVRRWSASLAILLGAASVLVVGIFLQADPDLWGHVRFGQLASAVGHVPSVEPYSFLSRPDGWINHEWLSELLFASAFDALGSFGLSLIPAFVLVLLVVGTFLHLRHHQSPASRAALLALLVLACLVVGGTVVRPHLFTYATFFILCLAIYYYERENRALAVMLVPLMIPVWAAFHGGVLAGLGLLLLAVGASSYRAFSTRASEPRTALRPVLIYSGCFLAALAFTGVSPYGYDLLLFLLETATVPRPEITEWQPVELRSYPGAIYLLLSGIALYSGIRGRHKWNPVEALIILVLALLPLTAVRHLPLFTLGIAVFVAPKLDVELWPRSEERQVQLRGPLAMFNLVTAAALVWASAYELECLEYSVRGDPARRSYPTSALQELSQYDQVSRLAIHFNWGEFAIWHLGPQVKVSIDGRRETVYPDSIYELNLSLMSGTDEWSRKLSSIEADAALYPMGSAADNLLDLSEDWTLTYSDSTASLYVSSDLQQLRHEADEQLRWTGNTPITDTRCFPF